MAAASGPRGRVARIVEGGLVRSVITTLIVLNAISLGLETVPTIAGPHGHLLHAFDTAVLMVFVFELAAKAYAFGGRFLRDGWNWFDMVVVGIALAPSPGGFAVLRALRVLRVLRLLSVVPQMRRVIGALLSAIPGISSVAAIIALLFYVGAVLTTRLFGERFPEWFGSIGDSMFTLFQVMTLESWSMGIARPVIEVYPHAWIFFVVFILTTTFSILNLVVGIVVDAMRVHAAEAPGPAAPDPVAAELARLSEEVRALRALVQAGRD